MNILPLDFERPLIDLEKCLEELISKTPQDLERISVMREKIALMRSDLYEHLTPWQRVQIARHPERPYFLDYVEHACTDFVELHGDRLFGDDKSMPGGLAKIGKHRCLLIGQQKGRDLKENITRNFGCPHPEGYRKALRLMKLAEKFRLPIVTFIDTPGAYPGIGAEERHIAQSIAQNLKEMMLLTVPILVIIVGEGCSGGALGIGVGDHIMMLENAYYSVISPEGCAAILWKHRKHAPDAASALRLTAEDLVQFELIDEVLLEPQGGAHRDIPHMAAALQEKIITVLNRLSQEAVDSIDGLLQRRYEKFRKMGVFLEEIEGKSLS